MYILSCTAGLTFIPHSCPFKPAQPRDTRVSVYSETTDKIDIVPPAYKTLTMPNSPPTHPPRLPNTSPSCRLRIRRDRPTLRKRKMIPKSFSKSSLTSYQLSGTTKEDGETAMKCSKRRGTYSDRDFDQVGHLLGCRQERVRWVVKTA